MHIKNIISRSSYFTFGFLLFVSFILPSTATATKKSDWETDMCETKKNQPLPITLELQLLPDHSIKNLTLELGVSGFRMKKQTPRYVEAARGSNDQTVYIGNFPVGGTQVSKTVTWHPAIRDAAVGCVHSVHLVRVRHNDLGQHINARNNASNSMNLTGTLRSITGDTRKARTMKSCKVKLRQIGHTSGAWMLVSKNCDTKKAK